MIVPACDRPTVAVPIRAQGRHVMESESAAMHRKIRQQACQLPITGFAHKAGVVGDLRVTALLVLAACDMAAERCRAAVLDRRHHLELLEADMTGIGLTPCRSMVAEDIRDLQHRAGHCRGRYAGGWSLSPISGFLPGFFLGFLRGCDSRSSGLLMFAIMPVATRV